jgi:hypothetical protein
MARGRVRPARSFAGTARGNRPATVGNRGGGRRPSVGGRRPGRGRGRGGNSARQFLGLHTGRQAAAVANAEAGAEFNPEIRQLREQAKGSRKREGDLGQWYAQLAADYQNAQNAGSAALQSVEDTTTQQLGEAADRSSADAAKLASEDERLAALVGGAKDTQGLAKIAQAGAAAQQARVALNLPVEQEQANYVAGLGSQKAAARMQGIEARQAERERRDKLLSQVGAVRKEKGAARVAGKEKIRESDRGYAAELAKLRLDRREAALKERELTQPSAYDQALIAQAELGLAGDRTSAAATRAAARQYSGARRRSAAASERAARSGERGRKATARGQVETANVYGSNRDKGGYNVREAVGLLRDGLGRKRVTASEAVDYLVNRGVDVQTAKAAVRRIARQRRVGQDVNGASLGR